MSLPNEIHPLQLAASSGAYEINQSLRFNSADSTYLYRTPSSAGNQRTWTWSVWLKRGSFGTEQNLFTPQYGGDGSNENQLYFLSDDTFRIYDSGAAWLLFDTTQVFRDPSAWFHLVIAVDTTQATSTDRFKLYINGVQVTVFDQSLYPTQNRELGWNSAVRHDIGRYAQGASKYFNGYMAEFHMVDGTRLTPSSFAEPDDNGVWRPIRYTGSYGTNGFYLKFDPSAINGIGHDHSGNGNNFTPSGFTTSGTGMDVMSDTPTTNWCTLNPNDSFLQTVSNGNLVSSNTNNVTTPGIRASMAMPSGKWYWEITCGVFTSASTWMIGVADTYEKISIANYTSSGSYLYYSGNGDKYNGSSHSSYGATYTTGDVIGVAYDADNGKIWFAKNNTWQNSGDPAAGTGEAYSGITGDKSPYVGTGLYQVESFWNFGQREFANPPGTIGATDYFNTVTWTGNGSSTSREITGCGFQPDLVWIKGRSVDGSGQRLQDVVRGAGTVLQANSPNQEFDDSSNLGAFTSDGFTLTTTGSSYNQSSATYVAWCWKAGGTAAADNSGTIDANVSANQDAGFSIVSWSGTGSTGTLAHGLDAAPKFIIVKDRDAQTRWIVYHEDMGNAGYVRLDEPSGFASDSTVFNSTSPTSSLFTVGTSANTNPSSGNDMIAYCWTEKTGVSKFGEYTGNGSSDGPVISCGFRPAMVIIKWYESVNTSESWHMYDNKRGGNPNNTVLFPDATADEEIPTDRYIQFTSDGFQLKSSGQAINRSGAKYIFMAWAATFTGSDDFKSLNTANLPEPTVKDGGAHFNTVLYTGTAATQSIPGVGFQPDLIWTKARNGSYSHNLTDAVRGITNGLTSNSTSAEYTIGLTSFDTNGFSMGAGNNQINGLNITYAAWNWKANGAGSSNPAGTIPSTVSANPTAGFSIVTYTGNNTAGATIGHGLGVKPSMIIVKSRSTAGTDWPVYHASLGATKIIPLDITDGAITISGSWNNTEPTSSVFTVGGGGASGSGDTNGSSRTYVAYCFSEVEGYSKFGSYQGNSSSDGTFVYCGFRPRWILFKNTSNSIATHWVMADSQRSEYNAVDDVLYASLANAETAPFGSTGYVDFLSNGFKLRYNWDYVNSGYTYIFAAFAEHPVGGSGVSPATAR